MEAMCEDESWLMDDVLRKLEKKSAKRVRKIEQEAYAEPKTVQQKDTRQTAAFDLSKRLNNFQSTSDGANHKALEEWRKRKMEHARKENSVEMELFQLKLDFSFPRD